MNGGRKYRSDAGRNRAIIGRAALAAVLVYLGYHAAFGRYGLLAWTRAQGRVAELNVKLKAAEAARAREADRLRRLVGPRPDLDYAEERAHEALGYAHANEIMLDLPSPEDGARTERADGR